MEGVPDWTSPAETPAERIARSPWRQRGHELLSNAGALAPGVCLAALLAAVGYGISRAGPVATSPILIAILLGLGLRNLFGLPSVYEHGLRLCLQRVLRIGVALLGVRLSLGALGAVGVVALPIAVGCVATALLLGAGASRIFGIPRRLGVLIAVGTAICGNSAIIAMGPILRADEEEVSYAVGTVTAFGLLALLTYPFLSHALFAGDTWRAGLFLGTAIHDTAQVAGAGLVYLQQYGDATALETATVTKLVRNLLMVAVIPLAATLNRAEGGGRASIRGLVPFFVLGFIGMVVLRTVGDVGERAFGVASPEAWQSVISGLTLLSTACLTVAMASVGLGTDLRRLRSLGLRPMVLGLSLAAVVGAVSFALISILT
ncbi:MAG: putative sulfate exporter family transporter [Deltaproteobacteria bacterium]|nr:putative sulfate exporter family transporter [Deltaproteobacteria bacterium]MBW2448598.1 putative sulfate exporter family transporter [Deltaproteobacteria bacterium]